MINADSHIHDYASNGLEQANEKIKINILISAIKNSVTLREMVINVKITHDIYEKKILTTFDQITFRL